MRKLKDETIQNLSLILSILTTILLLASLILSFINK